jgi:hypothetical protein
VDVGAEGNGFTVTVVGFEFIGHPADNTVAVYVSVWVGDSAKGFPVPIKPVAAPFQVTEVIAGAPPPPLKALVILIM